MGLRKRERFGILGTDTCQGVQKGRQAVQGVQHSPCQPQRPAAHASGSWKPSASGGKVENPVRWVG